MDMTEFEGPKKWFLKDPNPKIPTGNPEPGLSPSTLHLEKSYLTGKSLGFFFSPKACKTMIHNNKNCR